MKTMRGRMVTNFAAPIRAEQWDPFGRMRVTDLRAVLRMGGTVTGQLDYAAGGTWLR